MTTPPLLVAAGVIIEQGRVLITQRKAQTHLAGLWEFPGGKVHPGEDPRAALVRELREELGLETSVGAPAEITLHAYAEKTVLLLFFFAQRLAHSPPPAARDVAAFQWADADTLRALPFPPADLPILDLVLGKLTG